MCDPQLLKLVIRILLIDETVEPNLHPREKTQDLMKKMISNAKFQIGGFFNELSSTVLRSKF